MDGFVDANLYRENRDSNDDERSACVICKKKKKKRQYNEIVALFECGRFALTPEAGDALLFYCCLPLLLFFAVFIFINVVAVVYYAEIVSFCSSRLTLRKWFHGR